MKWLPAENELGREQKDILAEIFKTENNESISGFPGSGKTVILLYAVVNLRKKNPNSKILVVEFTHALIKMLQAAINELSKEQKYQELNLGNVEIRTYYDFAKRTNTQYDYIICDEVQDIPTIVVQYMKQRAKRVIVGGDSNQSIYTEDPQWRMAPCTSAELDTLLYPNKTNLTVIYRLTKKIISAINSFLPSMKILEGKASMIKTNVQIRLWKSGDKRQETKHIMDEAISRINNNDTVGILTPTHSKIIAFANFALEIAQKPIWVEQKTKYGNIDFASLNMHLKENNIPMQYVANGYGNFTSDENMITLTTYHSSKGLDFDTVLLPFCNAFDMPSMVTPTLFMVAMTRSRKDLFISYSSDRPCSYVHSFSSTCRYKDWCNDGVGSLLGNDNNNNEDEDFDF